MTITILYFAQLAEERGKKEESLEVTGPMTVHQLFLFVFEREPKGLRFAQNQEYVSEHTQVHDGDEIAFIPPLGGG